MLLAQIRSYLQQRGQTSLQDVAIHFDISPEAARFALQYWQKQGKLRPLRASCNSSCGSCGDSEDKDIYQWAGSTIPIRWAKHHNSR